MTVFEQAFAVVVGEEGGYDDTLADPGNWTGGSVNKGQLRGTKFGISAAAYPNLDIANLTLADAQAIYKRDYWDRILGDAMPPPVAMLVFDAAVNNGVPRASAWLQDAAGAYEDRQIGPATIAAVTHTVASTGWEALAVELLARRLAFMATLPTWRTFGLGWARRLCALPFKASKLVAN